jgi:hypothetical protein
MNRISWAIPLSLLAAFALDGLVFHTSLYPSIAEPGASAGIIRLFLQNELMRYKEGDSNQVLAIGDSRMGGFFPRLANQQNTGYVFATISAPGATPRCWYYMLREVDPEATRYKAVIIPVDDYDLNEVIEPFGDRLLDINMLAAELRYSDIPEFANSFDIPDRKVKAFVDLTFRGLVYKEDFQDFIRHPRSRLRNVALNRVDSHIWFYDVRGSEHSLEGVQVDWARKTVTVPPGATPEEKARYEHRFLDPRPMEEGRWAKYFEHWIGKIVEHYGGSHTRLIFIRLPRGPFIRPDQPPPNPDSYVRRLAGEPTILLTAEHYFEALEKPELFGDEIHLNARGSERFSPMVAHLVADELGKLQW